MAKGPSSWVTTALVRSISAFVACGLSLSIACGPSPSPDSQAKTSTEPTTILIATERASRGGRLVHVGADGARLAPLTSLASGSVVVDRSPTFTPDGQRIVFTSNREREDLSDTSLWVIATGGGGEPHRLTSGDYVDRDPRVSRDGAWVYFCSNRGGSFDLYRARIGESALSETEQITKSDKQILSPSLSPDGQMVAYMEVDEQGQSSLWRAASDGSGAPQRLSEGPMDMTPAWGAEGQIAFAARAEGRSDTDLYLMDTDGKNRRKVVDAPKTDETGPRWSYDGRYLFAIGMYRSATDGKPLLGSIVFVDLKERELRLRAIHDPSAVESRIGLALAPFAISARELHKNPPYQDALHDILLQTAIDNASKK